MKDRLKEIAEQKGYKTMKRHILICTHGKCGSEEESLKLWNYLKTRLKEREGDFSEATVARTKVGCLRICAGGTIAMVYPEGTLYAGLDEQKIDTIIEQHLFKGQVVDELAFYQADGICS